MATGGLTKRYRPAGTGLARHYTVADVALLAETDALHDTLSGPATQHLTLVEDTMDAKGKVKKRYPTAGHDAHPSTLAKGEVRRGGAAAPVAFDSPSSVAQPAVPGPTGHAGAAPPDAPSAVCVTIAGRAWHNAKRMQTGCLPTKMDALRALIADDIADVDRLIKLRLYSEVALINQLSHLHRRQRR